MTNPILKTLPTLELMATDGKLEGVTGEQVILLARRYARDNGMIFDGTLKGAIRLAEEAHHTVLADMDRRKAIADAEFNKPRKVIITTRKEGAREIDSRDAHLL
jgi:hypothetical protein